MIRFEHPAFLLLLLVIVPVVMLAWRSHAFESPIRWWTSLFLRIVVVIAIVGSLTEPTISRRTEGVATAFVLDRSRSVPAPLLADSRRLVEELVAAKPGKDDQFAVVTVAGGAEISTPPTSSGAIATPEFTGSREATDLASGVRRAISVLPPEMRKRVVLLSDGNESAGSLLAEAETAAAQGIPIDVVPLDFVTDNEVIVESLRAPTRARPSQAIDLRVALRSQRAATGTLFLREGGVTIDLAPDAPGDGLDVALEPGVRTIALPFPLAEAGTHRFEVVFEPSDAAADRLPENNVGTAVTFVAGPARVLIVDSSGGVESAPLASALEQASIPAEVRAPEDLEVDPAFLSGFDCIVLANVPRWQIDGELDRLLRAYVHDVGGGLLMLGGPESLGAGGWISSELAETLPVLLEPPGTRAYLRGSIAIVLDASGSMSAPAMGAFAHKQGMANEAAASGVRSMSHLDEVSVITFGGMPQVIVPRRAVGRDSVVERKIRGITSGGGTDLHAAMRLALEELAGSSAGTKHMIILTDGMTIGAPENGFELATRAKELGITVSTIGIEEGAQDPHLKRIAELADGKFHPVTDLKSARELPEIFIREFSEFGRRMTIEGDFQPAVLASTSGPLRALTAVPKIGGYTVTVPRPGLAEMHIVHPTTEAVDPIFASWNHGLGRAAVFTSDAGARWATAWPAWSEYRGFWEQTMRWLMRPAAPSNASTRTRIDGDRAIVELELLRPDGGFDVLTMPEGTLIAPDGQMRPLPLEQIGAGRWRGEFPLAESGSYLTNIALAEDAEGRRTSVFTAVNAPYSREFRATESNRALLEQIAARTGGRVIELDSPPGSVDAFLRTGTGAPFAMRGLWDLLAVLAAVAFLLDAAVRRILFDWDSARASARAAMASRAPGASTLAALGRVRGRSAPDQTGAADAGAAVDTGSRSQRGGFRDAPVIGRTGRDPAPAKSDVQRGPANPVDAEVREGSGSRRESSRDDGQPNAEDSDDNSTAARLLRAKRRAGDARDQLDR
jgi:Mg-chelatase subunit ChlD